MTTTPQALAGPWRMRWWMWCALLAFAAWLAVFGDKTPADGAVALSLPLRTVERPVAAAPSARPATAAAEPDEALRALVPRAQLLALRNGTAPPRPAVAGRTGAGRDLFASTSWSPPPPKPTPAPAPVVAAQAPRLPFTFVGKKQENGSWEVYLARDDKTFITREGTTLEGVYRVDKIAPPVLTLTYLPLAQVQNLAIGDIR